LASGHCAAEAVRALPEYERTYIINSTMLSQEDGFKDVHEP